MVKKLLLAYLCFYIAGCTSLSTRVISVGYREQYVENKSNKEKQTTPNEYETYEIKDSPVRAGEAFSLKTNTSSEKTVTIAKFKVSPNGDILEKNYSNLPDSFHPRFSDSDLNCLPCIKPIRYHTSEFYIAAPLLIVTAPVDAMQILLYVPVVVLGLVLFVPINAAACAIEGKAPNTCH